MTFLLRYRYFKATALKPAAYGGVAYFSYDFIIEFLRHHDENNLRPAVVDHIFAVSLISTLGAMAVTNNPKVALGAFIFSLVNVGPLSYWWTKMGTSGMSNRPVANIFYQNDVTPEEIEQFRMQDNAEMLAANMAKLPGYGVVHKGNSAFGINQ